MGAEQSKPSGPSTGNLSPRHISAQESRKNYNKTRKSAGVDTTGLYTISQIGRGKLTEHESKITADRVKHTGLELQRTISEAMREVKEEAKDIFKRTQEEAGETLKSGSAYLRLMAEHHPESFAALARNVVTRLATVPLNTGILSLFWASLALVLPLAP